MMALTRSADRAAAAAELVIKKGAAQCLMSTSVEKIRDLSSSIMRTTARDARRPGHARAA